MMKLVEKTGIPAVTTLMGKGAIDSRHPYISAILVFMVAMHRMWHSLSCDVMISIGTRFNDRITGKLSTLHKIVRLSILMWMPHLF